MNSDNEYNKGEELTFRQDLFRRMDTQDSMLKEIQLQTTKTNGRVTVLEATTKDYDEYKKVVSSLRGWKMWIMGGAGVIIFGGSYVGNLILKDIFHTAQENTRILIEEQKDKVAKEVVSTLEEKYKLQVK